MSKCGLCMPDKPCRSMGCPEDWPMTEIASLRAELETLRAERDEMKHISEGYKDACDRIIALLGERDRYLAALKQSAVRLEILTDRMRACHEETGKHELLDEAQAFADEARVAIAGGKE